MAWTAPMTAVANAIFTAAQFNTHVRDNFLETAPGKATAADRAIVTDGANAIREQSIGFLSWTPDWGTWGLGNGIFYADYRQLFGIVVWRLRLRVGTTTTPSGTFSFTLPVATVSNNSVVGSGFVNDDGTSSGRRTVAVRMSSSTTANLYMNDGTVTATAPFTFATADELIVGGAYLTSTMFA